MVIDANRKGTGRGWIVVGVDGSEASEEALRWAARQAQITGTKLLAVMAWEYPTSFGWAPPYPIEFNPESDARKALDATVEEALGADPPVDMESIVVEGRPSTELLQMAKGADLLVVGCRGHGAFTGMLLGSVSQHCMTHASCPVMVIHGHGAAAPVADAVLTSSVNRAG
jgi:nucleotide-binding universal stress UspA family protein